MNLRGAKPVTDESIKSFILSLKPMDALYDNTLPNVFIEQFYNWILSSERNTLEGLSLFSNKKLTAGTVQAFDHFYLLHKTRRFRFYRGEFMYHAACLKHGYNWEWLGEEPIRENDALIVSIPFSDTGIQHKQHAIFKHCEELGCPVLLDFAYYPCAKNIRLDLSRYPAVETLSFSISKAFHGAEFLRVGLRLQREDRDDGIDMFNCFNMHNRLSISVASQLISKYSIDHSWNQYETVYHQVCKEMNLEPTDCIMFGLGGEEYSQYNRGGNCNRVCISEVIGNRLN